MFQVHSLIVLWSDPAVGSSWMLFKSIRVRYQDIRRPIECVLQKSIEVFNWA